MHLVRFSNLSDVLMDWEGEFQTGHVSNAFCMVVDRECNHRLGIPAHLSCILRGDAYHSMQATAYRSTYQPIAQLAHPDQKTSNLIKILQTLYKVSTTLAPDVCYLASKMQ